MSQTIIIRRTERPIRITKVGVQGPPGDLLGPDVIPSPTPPTTRKDGSPLQVNDIWINTST